MKFKVRSPKSKVWYSKSGRGPKSEVGVWRLKSVRSLSEVCHKSENCPKSVWSGLHDSDHHWSAVLILITYIIMYFLSLFGYICMFVFVVWQINCSSLRVRSLTSVRCLTIKATIRRLKYVRSPQSEVWKLKSKVHNRKSDARSLTKSEVWCPTSVRKMSELCPKSEVPQMSVQNLESKNQSLKSKVCPKSESETKVWSQLSKFENEVQSLTPKIWSWKSEVENLSEVRSIIITFSYNTGIIYCVFVDQLWQQQANCTDKPAYSYNYIRPSQIFISPFF